MARALRLTLLAALALALGACGGGDATDPFAGRIDASTGDSATGLQCQADAECAALALPGPCWTARCEAATGTCVVAAREAGTPCDDGDPCTDGDTCEAGSCVGATDLCACATDADCPEDGDRCNGVPRCLPDADTGARRCQAAPGSEIVCDTSGDGACRATACDPDTGLCVADLPALDAPCDDGDPCTTDDRCAQVSLCRGTALDCDDGEPCTADTCVTDALPPGYDPALPDSACWHDAALEGLPCDDGDLCTDDDACQAGACVGTPATCGGSECTPGLCLPDTGECVPMGGPPNGTPCNDAPFCTTDGFCAGGECIGHSVACDAGPCHGEGTCDVTDGSCAATPLADGTACDDGDPCTTGDSCVAGACVGEPVDCASDDACRGPGSCDPSSGACVYPTPLPDATVCDDGDSCTVDDRCSAGVCGGMPKACNGGVIEPCAQWTCLEGECLRTPFEDEAPCDIGLSSPCADFRCASGECRPTPKAVGAACDDGLPCTVAETCDAYGRCVDPACPYEAGCVGQADCWGEPGTCDAEIAADGEPCDVPWGEWATCDAGSCVQPNGPECDGNPCTGPDFFDVTVGVCTPGPAKSEGTPCAPEEGCTTGDTCQSGQCTGGSPVDCAAGSCWTEGGEIIPCAELAAAADPQCPLSFVCQLYTGGRCEAVDAAEGASCAAPCLDGAGQCDRGQCTGAPLAEESACDVDACTPGTCQPASPSLCPAFGPCLQRVCASVASCGTDPCVIGTCDEALGQCTITANAPDDTPCDDGDSCTVGERCVAGACTPQQTNTRDCTGRECGDDGCGGSCGTCPLAGDVCVDGLCECTPDCGSKACGDDSCGGSCGDCGAGETCGATGQCYDASLCADAAAAGDPAGCELWAVDLDQIEGLATNPQLALLLANDSPAPADVTIEQVTGAGTVAAVADVTVAAETSETLLLAADGNMGSSLLAWTALRVTATAPIEAWQLNPSVPAHYSADGVRLLPTHRLGSDHRAVSAPQLEGANAEAWRGFVTIVAATGATTVTVQPTAATASGVGVPGASAGGEVQVALEAGQVLNLVSADTGGDLTGTRVQADEPVAVFSGHVAAAFDERCCADHLATQLLPTDAWGTVHVAAPSTPRGVAQDRWRITGGTDGTMVVLTPSLGGPYPLGAGQHVEVRSSEGFVVTADQPVQVSQLLPGGSEVAGPATCLTSAECAPGYECTTNPADPFSFQNVCVPPSCIVEGDPSCPAGTTCRCESNPFPTCSCRALGDPALIPVPPVSAHRARYRFAVPEGWHASYVSVAAPSGTTVTLDGAPMSGFTALSESSWEHAQVPVTPGVHLLEGSGPIGATLYGLDVDSAWGMGL